MESDSSVSLCPFSKKRSKMKIKGKIKEKMDREVDNKIVVSLMFNHSYLNIKIIVIMESFDYVQ